MTTTLAETGRADTQKGPKGFSPLRREALLALVLGALLAAVPLLGFPLLRSAPWDLAILFIVLAVLSDLIRVNVRYGSRRESIVLLEPLLVASAVLMPAWFTLAMVACAVILGAALTRSSWTALGFNLGAIVASTSAFVITYRLIVGPETIQTTAFVSQINALALLGLVAGGFVFATLNSYLSFRVIATVSEERISTNLGRALPLAWVSILVSVAGGAALVVIYAAAPALLPLVALAGGALLYGHVRTTRREKEVDRSSQLAALSDIITGGATSEMSESFLHLVRRTFDVDMAMMITDGEDLRVALSVDGEFQERPGDLADRVLLTMDVPQRGRLLLQADLPSPWTHGLVVPLGEATRRHGVVLLGSRSRRAALTEEGAELLTSLVGALVVAQRNAALSEQIQAITASQAEAVVAVDRSGRIAFVNPAAVELLGQPREALLEHHHQDAFELRDEAGVVDFLTAATSRESLTGQGTLTTTASDVLTVHYTASSIRPSPASGGHRPGVVLALSDVTEQVRAQQELLHSQDLLAEAGATLQQSLLPPLLPELPGALLAARYHAGAAGLEVGGDFYDVFDTLEDSWMVVIGDVCGRGAEAAALTALTRHTLRAVALRESSPARILEALNEAILRHHGDDRFCTVATARLRLGPAPSVRTSCAGHPSPLLVRDGTVTEIGPAGTLLGILPVIEVEEVEIPLEEGDVMVFYTDGVTEARNVSGEQFGDGALEVFLRSCSGLPAPEVTRRLETALVDFRGGPPDDDTAFVVISLGGETPAGGVPH